MSVSEFPRNEVLEWLEETMGPERATIMTDLLPPVGWGDIVTKRNIQAEVGGLRSEMQAGFAELRSEMQAAHSKLLLKLFFGLVATNATLVGLVLVATRLG